MSSNVKSTGLPLGLFCTDVFWKHSCLFVIIIPADSRLFDCTCYFEHGRHCLESSLKVGI